MDLICPDCGAYSAAVPGAVCKICGHVFSPEEISPGQSPVYTPPAPPTSVPEIAADPGTKDDADRTFPSGDGADGAYGRYPDRSPPDPRPVAPEHGSAGDADVSYEIIVDAEPAPPPGDENSGRFFRAAKMIVSFVSALTLALSVIFFAVGFVFVAREDAGWERHLYHDTNLFGFASDFRDKITDAGNNAADVIERLERRIYN